MSTVITGLFENPNRAADAMQALAAKGIPNDHISMMVGDNFDREAFAVNTRSKLPEGVAVGATAGGAIGALLGGLTAVGTVAATGGIGLLVAGPIVAALAGLGAGATTGGILGGAVGAAMPEHEVKYYEDALSKGSVLIGVHLADDEKDLKEVAKKTLKDQGAMKVSHA